MHKSSAFDAAPGEQRFPVPLSPQPLVVIVESASSLVTYSFHLVGWLV